MLVKVKAKERFMEAGILRVPGDEFEMEIIRARAMGNSIELIEEKKESGSTATNPSDKQITAPPMDKQIKRGKNK